MLASISVFLFVCPVKPDNESQSVPIDMCPLLEDFANVFAAPNSLPSSWSIEHTIDLIPGVSLPNTPSYRLSPQESTEIERQIQPNQPSSSPCALSKFIILIKKSYSGAWLLTIVHSTKPQSRTFILSLALTTCWT